jgi:coiled-coil domain-containing protein 115
MGVDDIDALLERYLHLLHEYTTARAELNNLQAGIYQNLARANFAAERGMRFGQDHYDERMQASRKLEVEVTEDGRMDFTMVDTAQAARQLETPSNDTVASSEGAGAGSDVPGDRNELSEQAPKSVKKPPSKDPIQWFGLLTPMPLRQAQSQSVKSVGEVVPRLVSINAEMLRIEIEVRRARKKRSKAEATAKRQQEVQSGQELTS